MLTVYNWEYLKSQIPEFFKQNGTTRPGDNRYRTGPIIVDGLRKRSLFVVRITRRVAVSVERRQGVRRGYPGFIGPRNEYKKASTSFGAFAIYWQTEELHALGSFNSVKDAIRFIKHSSTQPLNPA